MNKSRQKKWLAVSVISGFIGLTIALMFNLTISLAPAALFALGLYLFRLRKRRRTAKTENFKLKEREVLILTPSDN